MNIRIASEGFATHHLHDVEPNGDIVITPAARDRVVSVLQKARDAEPIPAYQHTFDVLIDALRG